MPPTVKTTSSELGVGVDDLTLGAHPMRSQVAVVDIQHHRDDE